MDLKVRYANRSLNYKRRVASTNILSPVPPPPLFNILKICLTAPGNPRPQRSERDSPRTRDFSRRRSERRRKRGEGRRKKQRRPRGRRTRKRRENGKRTKRRRGNGKRMKRRRRKGRRKMRGISRSRHSSRRSLRRTKRTRRRERGRGRRKSRRDRRKARRGRRGRARRRLWDWGPKKRRDRESGKRENGCRTTTTTLFPTVESPGRSGSRLPPTTGSMTGPLAENARKESTSASGRETGLVSGASGCI